MSLFPLLFSNWWEDLEHPHHLPAQHFGLGMNPKRLQQSQLMTSASPHFYNHPFQTMMNYYRPPIGTAVNGDPGLSVVKPDKDKFEVSLDIQHFAPHEIKVKVIDNYVVVEGKHDEKKDAHGFITRQFLRKYLIPEQCDVDKVSSNLSSDGVLTINVPRKEQADDTEKEKIVDIQLTGKPAIASLSSAERKSKTSKKGEKQDMEEKELLDEPMKNGNENQ